MRQPLVNAVANGQAIDGNHLVTCKNPRLPGGRIGRHQSDLISALHDPEAVKALADKWRIFFSELNAYIRQRLLHRLCQVGRGIYMLVEERGHVCSRRAAYKIKDVFLGISTAGLSELPVQLTADLAQGPFI